jgi:hypothetical protein
MIFVHNVPCDIVFKIPSSFWKFGHFAWSIATESQLTTLQIVSVYKHMLQPLYSFLWHFEVTISEASTSAFKCFFNKYFKPKCWGRHPFACSLE